MFGNSSREGDQGESKTPGFRCAKKNTVREAREDQPGAWESHLLLM